MVALVRQRELARKEMLAVERQIFVQRSEVKDMKRKLGLKDDDEDLVNQKVWRIPSSIYIFLYTDQHQQPKKKVMEAPAAQRPAGPQLRITNRAGSQIAEDMQPLEDVQAEKENEILRDIKQNIAKHIKWNEGYVDITRAPLSPPPEVNHEPAFRPAITTQLPTPPSSHTSENMMDLALDTNHSNFRDKLAPHSISMDGDTRKIPSFRRRIGRGGRLLIDRRNFGARCRVDLDPIKADRYKYDREDSDEEDMIYERDKYDIQVMQHRAIMAAKARDQAVAAAQAHAQAQAQAQAAQAQAQAQAQRRLQAEQVTVNNGAPNVGETMGSNPGPGTVAPSTET